MPPDPSPHPFDAQFATLASTACAGPATMLVAVEREFRAVDGENLDGRLDDLARPLFELTTSAADETAGALALAAHVAMPRDATDAESWLLERAVARGVAAAPLRAGLAVELGRRAGIAAGVLRHRDRWMVLVADGESRFAADVGPHAAAAGPTRGMSGCVCAHLLALEVLGGLAGAWRAEGDEQRARRAAGMRLLLPVDRDQRLAIRRELRRFGDGRRRA